MSETARQTAERVVSRLLDDEVIEEYSSHEEFEQRPGGPKDPYRQTTVKMAFKKGDFTGKRPGVPKAKDDDEDEGEGDGKGQSRESNPRFTWKAQESLRQECTSKEGDAGKAWKKGKKMSGQMVAKKPGKLSYRESLVRSVLEKIAVKKAMKQGKKMAGHMVAGKPGKVSYRGEAAIDERKMGSGMKGVGKKKVGAVAKAPGKVSFGKR